MTDDAREWAMGSAFLNEDGSPRLWFHGTDVHDPFNVFTRCEDHSVGFHFGSACAANSRISQIYRMGAPEENEGIVVPVVCRAVNPLRLEDQYTWDTHRMISALEEAGVLSEEEAEDCREEGLMELATLFAYIEEAGHDCIVYENVCEGDPEDSLIVWRSELLKSPYSRTFDREDPRLLSQIDTSDEDMAEWETLSTEIAVERERIAEDRAARAVAAPA